jgi:hypothetical protein
LQRLYVFFFIELGSRRVHVPVARRIRTPHPEASGMRFAWCPGGPGSTPHVSGRLGQSLGKSLSGS